MLSLRTNSAALSAVNAADRAGRAAAVAQTRLSTGYRINSAMDDAAGLQIATRLKAQSSGMAVAMRNVQNGISLMQTVGGVVQNIISLFSRMHDLAIQAADGSSSLADRQALQTEFASQYDEVWNQLSTQYAGEDLFISQAPQYHAKLWHLLNFQIGDASSDTMSVDLLPVLGQTPLSLKWGTSELQTVLTQDASQTVDDTAQAIDLWSAVGSAVGAVSNQLAHVYSNLANQSANTQAATGRILDTDYAAETASATSEQMLEQASTAMLKQSNSVVSLALSLVSS